MKNKMITPPRFGIFDTLSEYFFTLMPFIVLGIVYLYKNDFNKIIYISEWSFAAAILNGQIIVKVVKKNVEIVSKTKMIPVVEGIGFLFAFMIVLLFVPSLILLALVIMDNSQSFSLAISQIVIFVLSSIFYFVMSVALSQLEDVTIKQ